MGLIKNDARMKRTIILSITALLLMSFLSCSDKEVIQSGYAPIVQDNVLNVSVEKPQSRTAVDFYGGYLWSSEDVISVFGTETVNAPYKIVDQTDRNTTFTGHMTSLNETVTHSFYPYNEDVKSDGSQITFTLPKQRTVSDSERSPMVGFIEGNSKLCFYHTGGTLGLHVIGLPENAGVIEIESLGENSPYLSGSAIIENLEENLTYRILEGSRIVSFDVTSAGKAENVNNLYVPLQVGYYEKLVVTLKDITGNVLDSRSLSDLTVERCSMTIMPVINYSDKYFIYQLPEEVLQVSDLIDAFVTSDQLFISVDTLSSSYHYTVSQLLDIQKGTDNIAHVYADKDGWIQNIAINEITVFFQRNEDNTVNALIINGDEVEEVKSLEVKVPESSRAVQSTQISYMNDVTTAMGWLSAAGSVSSLLQGVKGVASWIFSSPLVGMAIENITASMIVGGVLGAGLGLVSLAALPASLTAGGAILLVSSIIGIVAGVYSVGSGVWDIICQKIFNMICGDMNVTTLKPQFVDEYYFGAGYEVNNPNNESTNAFKTLLQSWFVPECGLIKRTVSAGDKNVPRMIISNYNRESVHEVNDLSTSKVWNDDFFYTPQYKTYLTSYISFKDKYFVANYGNTELMTTNVSFKKIDVFSTYIDFEEEKFYFTIGVTCDSESEHLPFYLNLYKDGEVYDSKEWSRASNKNYVEFEFEVTPKELNMEDLSFKGNLALGFTVVKADKQNVLADKLIKVNYSEEASLKIESVSIGETREIVSSRADNEEDYYETDVTVTLKYTGGGWFKSYGISSSKGDVWDGTEEIWNDEYTVNRTLTLKYSEKQLPPTLNCFGILRNDKNLEGTGTITFEGVPITKGVVK